MEKTGVGKYKCTEGELIQIRFFCTPSRENVNVRRSFDGVNFITINTNSIQFSMGTSQITLRLQFAFIEQGGCINQVVMVDDPPNNDDRISVGADAGEMDFLSLIFKP